ncbi:MAG: hypothetical protein QUU85_15470, partial [Candidatus Eisenbacteria bacterium]|nr:hypothetical protein [Candidatus Eisenbacteria bacterium]
SLSILLMQYLTGGRWGAVLIRVLEAGSSTLPLIAIGFVPLVLTLGDLYPWARGAAPAGSALAEKQAYLNPAFVVGRAIFYFLCWGFLTRRAIVLAREIGGIGEPPLRSRMKRFAGPGLVLLTFTATAGLIGWVMALEPAWYSTIYGAMVGTEMVLVALGFGTLVLSLLHARAPFDRVLEPRIWNDLGNMLLAFVMLRAYMAFSQGLLIWYGNLPEEVSWYLRRTRHGYGVLLAAIALLQFAVPFVALLWRAVKRHRRRLAAVASLLLVTGTADAWWIVAPPLRPETVAPAWTDIALLAGFGMVWVAVFLFALFREPLLRVDDPRLLPYACLLYTSDA